MREKIKLLRIQTGKKSYPKLTLEDKAELYSGRYKNSYGYPCNPKQSGRRIIRKHILDY